MQPASRHPTVLAGLACVLAVAAVSLSAVALTLQVLEYPLQKRELAQSVTLLDPASDSPRVRIDADLAAGYVWVSDSSGWRQVSVCELCEKQKSPAD